jgi:uncharacterized protein (TIGR04255 family)
LHGFKTRLGNVAGSLSKLPEYERPPVSEVVCGVMFAPLKGLLAPHLGLLWERYKPDYAECKEAPPLAMQVEGPPAAEPDFEILEIPTLPRAWFVEPNGNRLVQVQRDRFHHNWRKMNAEDEYPRHERVLAVFNERLETFSSFLTENGLGELHLKQYEMTYVNHVLSGSGWNSVADIGSIFPDFGAIQEQVPGCWYTDTLNDKSRRVAPCRRRTSIVVSAPGASTVSRTPIRSSTGR